MTGDHRLQMDRCAGLTFRAQNPLWQTGSGAPKVWHYQYETAGGRLSTTIMVAFMTSSCATAYSVCIGTTATALTDMTTLVGLPDELLHRRRHLADFNNTKATDLSSAWDRGRRSTVGRA